MIWSSYLTNRPNKKRIRLKNQQTYTKNDQILQWHHFTPYSCDSKLFQKRFTIAFSLISLEGRSLKRLEDSSTSSRHSSLAKFDANSVQCQSSSASEKWRNQPSTPVSLLPVTASPLERTFSIAPLPLRTQRRIGTQDTLLCTFASSININMQQFYLII